MVKKGVKLFSGIKKSALKHFRDRGKGMGEDTENKFGINPDDLHKSSKRSKGGPNMSEENIIKLAEDAYRGKKVDEARSQIEYWVSQFKGVDPNSTEAKTSSKWITIFDKKIKELADLEKSREHIKIIYKDVTELQPLVNDRIKNITDILEKIINNIDHLTPGNILFEQNFNSLIKIVNESIILKTGTTISDLTEAIIYLNKVKVEYEDFTKKELKISYLKNNDIRKYVGLLAKKKEDLIKKSTSSEFLSKIDQIVEVLKVIVIDPQEVLDAMNYYKYPKTIGNNLKAQFENEVIQALPQLKQYYIELITNIENYKDNHDKYENLRNSIKEISKKYSSLDSKECQDFITNKLTELDNEIYTTYGKEIVDYCIEYNAKLSEAMNNLQTLGYNSPYFENAYRKTISLIEEMKSKGTSIGIKVEFNEESQKITIDYPNNVIAQFKKQIVSDEVIQKMKADKNNKKAKDKQRDALKLKCKTFYANHFGYLSECLKRLEQPNPTANLDTSEFNLLSKDEIELIKNDTFSQMEQSFYQKYSKEFCSSMKALIDKVTSIRSKMSRLNAQKDNSPTLLADYETVIKEIKNLKNNYDKKYLQSVTFDDKTGFLNIKYNNDILPEYSEQLVPQALIDKVKELKKKNPTPSPNPRPTPNPNPGSSPSPTPTPNPSGPHSVEEENDINLYLSNIDAINKKIELINIYNTRGFVTDITNIQGCINFENEAQKLDQDIMRLRVELSNSSVNFLNKYHKYILSFDKVKNATINDIIFDNSNSDYKDFIAKVDQDIIEAEEEIIDLANERENADQIRLTELNARIKELLKYIEAKNSLVNRRFIEECRTSKIDIVKELQNRRNNKKEWRKNLRKIKNNEKVTPTPKPKPQPQPNPSPSNEGPSVTVKVPNGKVNPNRKLVFNPRNKVQLVNKEKDFIGIADGVTISLIKSGIKIKYSQQLKEKLSQLNAKLSLVNKDNVRSRTSQKIDNNQEEQVIAFKDDRDLLNNDEYKNYKIEIRIPTENRKGTDVLYEYDFNQEGKARTR